MRTTDLPIAPCLCAGSIGSIAWRSIVRLLLGEQAVDADCIRIEEQVSGTYKLTGSAMCAGTDEGDSVSIVGDGLEFESVEQAEATGIAWAREIGVERLFVSTGTRARPLVLMEIDKPL